jgi:predicted PurR-regulated permease PerM
LILQLITAVYPNFQQKKLMMNPDSILLIPTDEYIRAAPDPQLSSSQSNILHTLLREEDQCDYNQLLNIQLPNDIQHILYQVTSFLTNHFHYILHFFLFSYVHFFIFLLPQHGWLLSYSKNYAFNNIHWIS